MLVWNSQFGMCNCALSWIRVCRLQTLNTFLCTKRNVEAFQFYSKYLFSSKCFIENILIIRNWKLNEWFTVKTIEVLQWMIGIWTNYLFISLVSAKLMNLMNKESICTWTAVEILMYYLEYCALRYTSYSLIVITL